MSAATAASPQNRPSGAPPRALEDTGQTIEQLDALGVLMGKARTAVSGVIFGQDSVVEQTLITVLSGGHALLIGVPGLGKSRLVETMGVVLGLNTKRVQFTPDLMPADIIGGEVLDEVDGRRSFRFVPGPVFCQLLMADEINRASPRTQSALLQSMQEQRVAIAGFEHRLPRPFHVLATQNPIEQEGTYPLPEAQLDRFLLAIDITYPDIDSERAMLLATTGSESQGADPVMTPEQLIDAQSLIRRMPIGEAVVDAILAMVRGGRPESTDLDVVRHHVAWGPGPRAAQALMLACRSRAILGGRLMPSLDDVAALAGPVLRHRMALNFSARADGVALDEVIDRLVERLG
jgi:MoxR-like ATPase